jgi:hypothetical protein
MSKAKRREQDTVKGKACLDQCYVSKYKERLKSKSPSVEILDHEILELITKIYSKSLSRCHVL